MYKANNGRYEKTEYKRCGNSGLKLPRVSLGLWHNFGDVDIFSNAREMIFGAFDMGITHFDLANNYGPSPGSAEETFGKVMRDDLSGYRDELVISSKAGYNMWPGPYGEWGSRKYMLASLDQSLKRMGLEYVDIFYSHRFDPGTPLEETMGALASAVQQGKALYVGISSYQPEDTRRAAAILKDMNTPCLIHQPSYSLLNRWIEDGLTDVLDEEQIGCIVFSPLSQGLLTNKYLKGIPEDSRAAKGGFLKKDSITPELVDKLKKLNDLAAERGQSLAQMAISWVLHNKTVTSAVIGASRLSQIADCVQAADKTDFTMDELSRIDTILT
jgi:L-glyceraldehyde 3-phosphate reductase